MRLIRPTRLVAVLLLSLFLALPSGGQRPRGRPAGRELLQSYRNLGKAYYEQGKYADAREQFQRVAVSRQAGAADFLNLGLAQMQLQDYDNALGSFTTARQMAPGLPAVDYNLGILYYRQGRYPLAEAALEKVLQRNPGDPASWFNLGRARFHQGKLEPALEAYRRVIGMGFSQAQNFYVVALFHGFTALNRLRRTQEAHVLLLQHQKFRERLPSVALEPAALEGGRYGGVLVRAAGGPPKRRAPEGLSLTEVTGAWRLPEVRPPVIAGDHIAPGRALAVADYDGDGHLDLYLATAAGGRLWRNRGAARMEDVTEAAGLRPHSPVAAAVFADYDNRGRPSLFVAARDGFHIYAPRPEGGFREGSEAAGVHIAHPATAVRLFDADNDGSLDLYVGLAGDQGGSRFFRNNGDGTFADVTSAAGLGSDRVAVRQALFAPLNDDPYLDLLVVRENEPPLLFLNRGGGQFRLAETSDGLRRTAYGVYVADLNRDGHFDLFVSGPGRYEVLFNRGSGQFRTGPGLPVSPAGEGARESVLLADLNGDGLDDLLLQDGEGRWHFLANVGGSFVEETLSMPPLPGLVEATVTALASPQELNLLGLSETGQMVLLAVQGSGARWLEITLGGSKSNREGVGAIVELKAGTYYRRLVAAGGKLHVSMAGLPKLDVVRVTWPTAIIQNLTNVPTNRAVRVEESERLASSCPLLYIWDGQKWQYLTDVLGVAPLGALAPDGSYLPANPQEFVRLPPSLRPQDGLFVFQFTDEMREVDYFDRVQLLAVDHAPEEEILADERFAVSPVAPALYRIRSRYAPAAARDDHGRDARHRLAQADEFTVDDFHRERVPGLANLHTLTLELGPQATAATTSLWLTGWVFWSDSNSGRALMSRGPKIMGPALQVRDAAGEWVTVISDIGIPSGANRTMRVDLRHRFLSPDRSVRLVTNLAVYWDRVFFSTDDELITPTVSLLPLSAELRYRGFSRPVRLPGRADSFPYAEVEADAPWDPARGYYTRYGGVKELVTSFDERLVVMAPGDELSVAFDQAALPALPSGRRRAMFLRLEGWAKDAEPNTAAGSTVSPMPIRDMPGYPYEPTSQPISPEYEDYLRAYQTRPGYALIPSLAPGHLHE